MSAGAVVLALVLVEGLAQAQHRGGGGGASVGRGGGGSAQGAPAKGGKYTIQPLNLHRENLATEGFATAARARMRNGDCAGALDSFDQALVSSTDPTLHRDRGLCHEQLGDPYPAMEDYRAYLMASPDAADADNIRQRLERLEMDNLKHSSAPVAGDEPGARSTSSGGGNGGGGSSSASADSGSSTASATVSIDTGDGEKRDAMETVEHDHDELNSSLRAGTGVSLAPFLSAHKWLLPGSSFGDGDTWSEAVGLQLRWSVAAQSAFVFEAGYEIFNATDVATVGGLTSQIGYELRVPFKPSYRDQFLLGVGMGYEYLVFSPKDASYTGASGGGFVPRGRVGWRHMIAASVAFDLTLDAGVTAKALSQGSFLTSAGDQAVEMVGVNFGVGWGL
jgi:hypothetical protein